MDVFDLARGRGNPVYLQILEQVERRIAAGTLKPGDALPSVRVLATELRVNPNTIVRVYRELEYRGLVESRQGEGTFIAAGAAREVAGEALLKEEAMRFVRKARELGVSRQDAVTTVQTIWREEDANDRLRRSAALRDSDVPVREAERPRAARARATSG